MEGSLSLLTCASGSGTRLSLGTSGGDTSVFSNSISFGSISYKYFNDEE